MIHISPPNALIVPLDGERGRAVQSVLARTDWALLARQKAALLAAAGHSSERELLSGLLHFLDALMDAAEADGSPVVFGGGSNV